VNIPLFTAIPFSSHIECAILEPGGQNRMLRTILAALAAGALMAPIAVGAERPDLSGMWKADLAKCEFGMESAPASLVFGVEQKGLTFRVERVRQEDGKETNTARTLEAKWDGTAFIIQYQATYQSYNLEISEKWSLSDDKKTLTVLRSISAGGGGTDQKLVFHKEPPQ
jgi:hypothetical protein